jgi:cation transport ATPase
MGRNRHPQAIQTGFQTGIWTPHAPDSQPTEVAIQSAGITLVKGDLAGIARAIVLSRATMRNIRENLVCAFAYNTIGIPIAAGVLYPAFGLLLSPIVAALAISLSSVSVIANALRLRTLKL